MSSQVHNDNVEETEQMIKQHRVQVDSMVTSTGGTFASTMVKTGERFDIKKLKPSACYMVCLTLYCGLSSQLLAPALCATGAAWQALQY